MLAFPASSTISIVSLVVISLQVIDKMQFKNMDRAVRVTLIAALGAGLILPAVLGIPMDLPNPNSLREPASRLDAFNEHNEHGDEESPDVHASISHYQAGVQRYLNAVRSSSDAAAALLRLSTQGTEHDGVMRPHNGVASAGMATGETDAADPRTSASQPEVLEGTAPAQSEAHGMDIADLHSRLFAYARGQPLPLTERDRTIGLDRIMHELLEQEDLTYAAKLKKQHIDLSSALNTNVQQFRTTLRLNMFTQAKDYHMVSDDLIVNRLSSRSEWYQTMVAREYERPTEKYLQAWQIQRLGPLSAIHYLGTIKVKHSRQLKSILEHLPSYGGFKLLQWPDQYHYFIVPTRDLFQYARTST